MTILYRLNCLGVGELRLMQMCFKMYFLKHFIVNVKLICKRVAINNILVLSLLFFLSRLQDIWVWYLENSLLLFSTDRELFQYKLKRHFQLYELFVWYCRMHPKTILRKYMKPKGPAWHSNT